ncbi:hypothetical protein GGI42DRAFT_357187 [Trichoderma sp. SZMC 28013]
MPRNVASPRGVCRLSACILISGYENPERARERAGFAFVHDAAMILPPQTVVCSRRNTATITPCIAQYQSSWLLETPLAMFEFLATGQSSKPKLKPKLSLTWRVPASGLEAREAQSMCSLFGRQARVQSKTPKENACICKSESLTKSPANPSKRHPCALT